MTRAFKFGVVVQTKVTSLMDERLEQIAVKLGISKADLLRIVIQALIQKDIDVATVVKFSTMEEAVKRMKALRKTVGEELL